MLWGCFAVSGKLHKIDGRIIMKGYLQILPLHLKSNHIKNSETVQTWLLLAWVDLMASKSIWSRCCMLIDILI